MQPQNTQRFSDYFDQKDVTYVGLEGNHGVFQNSSDGPSAVALFMVVRRPIW